MAMVKPGSSSMASSSFCRYSWFSQVAVVFSISFASRKARYAAMFSVGIVEICESSRVVSVTRMAEVMALAISDCTSNIFVAVNSRSKVCAH